MSSPTGTSAPILEEGWPGGQQGGGDHMEVEDAKEPQEGEKVAGGQSPSPRGSAPPWLQGPCSSATRRCTSMGGPGCSPALLVLLCLVLLPAASDQECVEYQEQAVAAGRVLQLLPERPPLEWAKVEWRAQLDAGHRQRILTAEKNSVASPPRGHFSGRATFQQETVSLRISPVSAADSGTYEAGFEDASGSITALCFQVSVWEPIGQLLLEARILHWEQGWCNLSLLCTVPSTGSVSYSWSCSGDALGALGHQPRLHLQLRGDANSTVCRCNASNAVSWDTASTDAGAACRAAAPGLFRIIPWGIVAVSLGLALAISVALVVTCYWWRKRRKDPPGGCVEQSLTVYNEVGKAETAQDPNGTGEVALEGNTIYAVICPKTLGPSCHRGPENTTIYSMVQPTGKSSVRRKRLDPALFSTAYVDVMDTGLVGR
ncbi:natural killer cell receptor 2B4 isoform X1 [Falco biarmicus]|uniref:natural killer cell receptor 2B4 isoform X1 n=1 Tax=Falco biarmicus TaxID=345155 RepID=UPI0024BC5DDA|nr:natural killer cell receptor 2B4 isoform X1 [Falco biarmicus]